MNFCTRCQSYYQEPGTCNCYAEARPAPQPEPFVPSVYPTYPPTVVPPYLFPPYTWTCEGPAYTIWYGND